jgi:hypothetical protein
MLPGQPERELRDRPGDRCGWRNDGVTASAARSHSIPPLRHRENEKPHRR